MLEIIYFRIVNDMADQSSCSHTKLDLFGDVDAIKWFMNCSKKTIFEKIDKFERYQLEESQTKFFDYIFAESF